MLAGGAGVVLMPQVNLAAAAREAGLRVPGVYAALAARERERKERSDRMAARMMAEHGYFFRRHNGLLAEQLEAGESVVVSTGAVELALWDRDRERDASAGRVRLPFDSGVRCVQVSSDDQIIPARGLDPHLGGPIAEGH